MTFEHAPAPRFPWVSIILLNYNGYQDTIECLESLFKLEYPSFSIVVVDNNSPDQSLDHINAWLQKNSLETDSLQSKIKAAGAFWQQVPYAPGQSWPSSETKKALVTTVQAGQNLGFAGGNNVGLRLAQSLFAPDFVWFLNNDTVVESDSLTQLVQQAQQDQKQGLPIGIWGSKLLYYHQRDTIQAIGGKLNLTTLTTTHLAEGQKDSLTYQEPHPSLDYVVGASLFVSRAFIEAVGPLSEDYFLYFEELDWAKRGQKAGFSLGFVPASKVYHKEGRSIGSHSAGKKKSDLADYHGMRSKIIFFRKFYPERAWQLNTLVLASAVLRVSRFQFKRAWRVLQLLGGAK
ncbi:glycosyltransferase family 2 protein [Rufibacter glacialis]|uniref:Glycosyltransferase family 2 protein n=1 Tax=Rufibacter glacialis TaxID=1259555 RepID=A0A5M8QJU1_9BACT|nr:glycosyltransferase family 2 protein [Rufibacter glacialis]KAA6434592.1 glycosyltransferase family 2 protein [Rufibacter glacialis]GGK70822.1 rhamnosyltransferase [Rufibacter glacialis]